jgi:hypothetical protein
MDLCLQVIINIFEAPRGTAEICNVLDVCFLKFFVSLKPLDEAHQLLDGLVFA